MLFHCISSNSIFYVGYNVVPKKAKELSAKEVRDLSKPGLHAVGGVSGLLLQVTKTGARSWILRTVVGTKRRDIGLGGFPDVTLAIAREQAREMKAAIRQGIDPVEERKGNRSDLIAKQAKSVTFEALAAEYVAKKAKDFKTTKQVQKLTNQLKYYAFPFIGQLVVSDIERAHIEQMLRPIWETKNETANRVRQNVERILDLGGVKGLRSGDNPARWAGNLELSLTSRKKTNQVTHYAALPVVQINVFMAELRKQDWMGAKALEWIILTACRSCEVRGARWDEIDLAKQLWMIPAGRMKGGKTHTVPLNDAAMKLLESMGYTSEYIFPGSRGGMLADATISRVPKRIGYDVTAHGFRSTFKDWASEYSTYSDEVSELALAHVNSNATRAAYARSQLIDKRRQLMADWQQFIEQ